MSVHVGPTVTVNNTTVYVNSCNDAAKSLGLTGVPAGTPAPHATQTMLAQMQTLLISKFSTTFPNEALPPSNHDGGYVGPWSNNISGTAPLCVVKQIQQDFSNWNLPTDPASKDYFATTIAKAITSHIASQAGGAGFTSGTHDITGSESLYWMAGYATVSIAQDELGILYVFGATEGIWMPPTA